MTGGATAYWCSVMHVRAEGKKHSFRNRTLCWLVDLDVWCGFRWPLRLVAGFEAADHLGDPDRSIRENLDRFLALNGLARPHRVLMFAQARQFGYAFDPVSVFFCLDPDGMTRMAVMEVRNTYGERHCYLLTLDEAGRASTDKQLYVSPMFPVDGRYVVRLRLSATRMDLAVVLRRDQSGHRRTGVEHTALSAGLHGRRLPPLVGVALLVLRPRHSRATIAAIKAEAGRLIGAGLAVRRHRLHRPQPGVDGHQAPTNGESNT